MATRWPQVVAYILPRIPILLGMSISISNIATPRGCKPLFGRKSHQKRESILGHVRQVVHALLQAVVQTPHLIGGVNTCNMKKIFNDLERIADMCGRDGLNHSQSVLTDWYNS